MTNPQKTRLVLETLMLNLLDARMADVPVNYPRNSNEYTIHRTNGNDFFKRNRVLPVVKTLKKLGCIEEKIGFRNPKTGYGWQTRM